MNQNRVDFRMSAIDLRGKSYHLLSQEGPLPLASARQVARLRGDATGAPPRQRERV